MESSCAKSPPKPDFLLKVPVQVGSDPAIMLEKEMVAVEAELCARKATEREQVRKDRVARDERRPRDTKEASRPAEIAERQRAAKSDAADDKARI